MLEQSLSKKIFVPQKRTNAICRHHLIELLYQGIHKKAIIITAPPGSGKTTLVTDFVAEADVQVCWDVMNRSDQEVRSLLDGLVASFSQKFPQVGQTARQILETSTQPETKARSILDALIHDLNLNVHEYFLLVIEDFHALEENTSCTNIISQLIELSPENCHFIITSRNPITLSGLSKWTMNQELMRISADQFALSVSEIKELFSTTFSVEISQEQATAIQEATEGWLPAILLRGVKGNLEISKVKQLPNREDLYAYLAEEVFQKQTKNVQDFLIATAILDELRPEFCDLLLDIRNSAYILEELCQKNLFVIRMEGDSPHFHYQEVFKDFLVNQSVVANSEYTAILHYKAALIYEKEKQYDEAFRHFIKARKPFEASRIVQSIGESYVRNGKWSIVLSWLESLPKAHVTSSPALLILKAAAQVHSGDSAESARILTGLINEKVFERDILMQIKLLNWRCASLRMMGQFDEAKRDIKNAISLLNYNGGSPEVKGDVYRQLGDICAEQGQFKGALRYQKVALKNYNITHDLSLTSQVHNSLGIIYKRSGDMDKAIYHLENAREGWQKMKNYGLLSSTLNNIAIIYQRKGQCEMALETLRLGMEYSKKYGYKRTEACLLLTTGEILRDTGNYKEALTNFQQGLEIAREVIEPYFVTYALLGIGEVEKLLGNIDKAAVVLSEASIQAENHKQPYESILIKIQEALIENERGQGPNAIKTLNYCRGYLSKVGDKDTLARVYFHLAHLAFLNRQYSDVSPFINELEKLVREIEHTEFLVPECKQAILMLQYCVNKKIGGTIFPSMLEKIKRNAKRTPSSSLDQETLVNNHITNVNVTTLGEIKVTVNDRVIKEEEWRSGRAREIFIYLLSTSFPQSREQVATALWPELGPARGSGNFHINLYRARQAITPVIFIQEGGKYSINPEVNISFDLFRFRDLIKLSVALTEHEQIACLENAKSLYKGSFANEIYSEWTEEIRHQTENQYIEVLAHLANLYREQNNGLKAIETLKSLIEVDRYNDDAYSRLMEIQMARNDNAGARLTYQQYCQNVVQEANVLSPRVERLYEKLLNNNS